MAPVLRVLAVQAPPQHALDSGRVARFAADVQRRVLAVGEGNGPLLVVYPELHLAGTAGCAEAEALDLLSTAAHPLAGHPLIDGLAAAARAAGVWLVPGSLVERGPAGELFNTAVAFSPAGDLVAAYRKMFPWRPSEPFDPGTEFVCFDIPGTARIGLSICYDAWFPEVSRHLGWLGADLIANVVHTTTPDRAQELVLARANSIANQVFTVSVNSAGPPGVGQSLIVDPEGTVIAATPDAAPAQLAATLDLGHVDYTRTTGTAGTNRLWSQFRDGDPLIPLPLYGGRIDPRTWSPPPPIRPTPPT
jgi:predicted amidohydrolase